MEAQHSIPPSQSSWLVTGKLYLHTIQIPTQVKQIFIPKQTKWWVYFSVTHMEASIYKIFSCFVIQVCEPEVSWLCFLSRMEQTAWKPFKYLKYLPIFTWHIPVTAIFCAHHKMKFPEIKWYRFYNKQWSMGKYNTTVLAANDYAWLLNNVMSLYYTHYLWAIICKKFLYTVQTVGYKTINDGLNTFVLWF